jgi:hypothetical protein
VDQIEEPVCRDYGLTVTVILHEIYAPRLAAEMFLELEEICKRAGIHYWFDFGSRFYLASEFKDSYLKDQPLFYVSNSEDQNYILLFCNEWLKKSGAQHDR